MSADFVNPDLEETLLPDEKEQDFEDIEQALESSPPADRIRDRREREKGEVDYNSQYSQLEADYLLHMHHDRDEGFLQLDLDGESSRTKSMLGSEENNEVVELELFVPSIFDGKVAVVDHYGALNIYDAREDRVAKTGNLNEELVREVGARISSEHGVQLPETANRYENLRKKIDNAKSSDKRSELKQNYVRDAWRGGIYNATDSDVVLEVDNKAYQGVKNWITQDDFAENLFELCEEAARVIEEDPDFQKKELELDSQDNLYNRGKNFDKYRIPGTGNDGRMSVNISQAGTEGTPYEATIEIAGDHDFYRRKGYTFFS